MLFLAAKMLPKVAIADSEEQVTARTITACAQVFLQQLLQLVRLRPSDPVAFHAQMATTRKACFRASSLFEPARAIRFKSRIRASLPIAFDAVSQPPLRVRSRLRIRDTSLP